MSERVYRVQGTRDRTVVTAIMAEQRALIARIGEALGKRTAEKAELERKRSLASVDAFVGGDEDQDRRWVEEINDAGRSVGMLTLAVELAKSELSTMQAWDRGLSQEEANAADTRRYAVQQAEKARR